jgi:cytidyltransferase-like protein
MKTIVITSGYFNPLHPWHIECFELCKALGDELRVIINSDDQVRAKTGQEEVFQDESVRMRIVSALKPVDRVILSVDTDGSVCESIRYVVEQMRSEYGPDVKIIFGKWGDRFASNIPEVQVCKELWVEIRDWLWANTHNSSDYRARIR